MFLLKFGIFFFCGFIKNFRCFCYAFLYLSDIVNVILIQLTQQSCIMSFNCIDLCNDCLIRTSICMPVRCRINLDLGREKYMPEYWRPRRPKGQAAVSVPDLGVTLKDVLKMS